MQVDWTRFTVENAVKSTTTADPTQVETVRVATKLDRVHPIGSMERSKDPHGTGKEDR
jgi:hypothetical protein